MTKQEMKAAAKIEAARIAALAEINNAHVGDFAPATDTGDVVTQSAPLVLSDDMKAVDPASVGITGRTLAFFSVLPELFAVAKEPRKSGKYQHQLAFTGYSEGCNPAMPNVALHTATGNPYPADKVTVDKITVSSPKYDHYRDNVYLAHAMFARLASSDSALSAHSLYFNTDVVAEASKLKGATITRRDLTNGNHVYYGAYDTLRDLEACGFIFATNGAKGIRRATTEYRINERFRAAPVAADATVA